jgi:hypothetical protein
VFSMSKIFLVFIPIHSMELSHVNVCLRVMSTVSRDANLAAQGTRLLDNNVSTAPKYILP